LQAYACIPQCSFSVNPCIISHLTGKGFCILKKAIYLIYLSAGVTLLFSGTIDFSFEKLRTCYYLK
ncbi:hypothetical protein, partial [Escherichia coli]|uniref:hypothetical protein n=1 Tax=Escherichia coli TaxID=562 RepID=UPI002855CEFC